MDKHHIENAAENLAKVHRAAYRSSQEFYDSLGITMPQAFVIGYIKQNKDPKMTQIAEDSSVTTAAITGMIDRLGELGYVARKSDEHDRRVSRIVLTSKGLLLNEQIHQSRVRALERVFADLSPSDVSAYVATLEKFVSLIEKKEVFVHGKK